MKIIKSLNTKQIIIYMNILFCAKGRLGNALFRYLGCTIFSLKYNLPYVTQPVTSINRRDISGNITDYIFKLPWDDMLFDQFIEFDKKGEYPPLPKSGDAALPCQPHRCTYRVFYEQAQALRVQRCLRLRIVSLQPSQGRSVSWIGIQPSRLMKEN